MIAAQSPPISLINKDKDTQNLISKKTAVPLQDIVNVMQAKSDDSNKSKNTDFAAILAAARVCPKDEIPEEPACLLIEKDGKDSIIGTMGNLSTIAGRAKAKKTFAVSFAIAAAVASSLILNRIKGQLPEGKQTVLLFDTEQSRHHVLKVVKRICRLCEIDDPPNLEVYSLRPFSPDDRLKAIDYALNNTPGIGLVVIDGVRDLAVDPVLDAEQASNIMTHLLQWTDRLNIHIMCVLHQNKNDTNLRGHLGTELVNKSETVISVTRDSKDKDISHVEAEYCRNREFEPFYFSVDDTGLPYLVDENPDDNRTKIQLGKYAKANRLSADTMTVETIKAIVERAYSQETLLGYSQLVTNIAEAAQYLGVILSQVRIRELIQRITLTGMVSKFRPEKARWDFYQINQDPSSQPTY